MLTSLPGGPSDYQSGGLNHGRYCNEITRLVTSSQTPLIDYLFYSQAHPMWFCLQHDIFICHVFISGNILIDVFLFIENNRRGAA